MSINNGKYETQRSLSTAGRADEESNVWKQIQHLARTKRTQQLNADPPKRQGRKPSVGRGGRGGRGGPRPNSGRKKSVPKVSYWIDESFRFFFSLCMVQSKGSLTSEANTLRTACQSVFYGWFKNAKKQKTKPKKKKNKLKCKML